MLSDTKIMVLSQQTRSAGMVSPEESHSWFELVYYISCEGILTLDGTAHEIRPGRFVTTRPHTPHSELHSAAGTVFYCIFQCDVNLTNMVFDDDAEHTIKKLCEAMIAEQRRPRAYSEELQRLILSELLLRIMRWDSARVDIRRDITYAAECIRKNFREPISMQQLAADIGYGYDYFHHRFQEAYGCPPKQYQMNCRIACAKELLASGRYTCTEVAYLSGFSDSAQFSRIFARHTGVTPAKWRQRVEK